jgi:hypothetical protein
VLSTKSPGWSRTAKRRRRNPLDQPTDYSGIGRILGHNVACRFDGAVGGVSEDDDEREAGHGGAIFDGAEGFDVNESAGVTRDKQFANAFVRRKSVQEAPGLSAQEMIVAEGA